MGQENLIKKLIFGWQYVPIADDFLRDIKRKKLVYIRMIDFDKNQRKCSKIEKFTNLLLKYAKRLFIGVQTWSCAQLNCAGNQNVENSTCFILTNVVKFPLYFFQEELEMKKTLVLVALGVAALGFTACGKSEATTETVATTEIATIATVEDATVATASEATPATASEATASAAEAEDAE